MSENLNADIKKIESEFISDLEGKTRSEDSSSGFRNQDPPPRREGFIPDRVLTFLLGLKNSALLRFLAKGVGEQTEKNLKDLYTPDEDEFKIYRECLEDFIREHYAAYIDDIQKMNTGLAALFLYESIRFKSAMDLVRTDPRVRKPDVEAQATPL